MGKQDARAAVDDHYRSIAPARSARVDVLSRSAVAGWALEPAFGALQVALVFQQDAHRGLQRG